MTIGCVIDNVIIDFLRLLFQRYGLDEVISEVISD